MLQGSNRVKGHGDFLNKPMLHFTADRVQFSVVLGAGQPVDLEKATADFDLFQKIRHFSNVGGLQ